MPIIPKTNTEQYGGQLPETRLPLSGVQPPDLGMDKVMSATEEFLLREKQKADDLAINEYKINLTNESLNIFNESNKTKGLDTIGLTEQALKRFNNFAVKGQGNAANQTQITEFRKVALYEGVKIRGHTEEHTRVEIENYADEQDNRIIAQQQDYALVNKKDVEAVSISIGKILKQIEARGMRKGWGDSAIAMEQVKTRSSVHKAIIKSYLSGGQDLFAKQWYDDNYEVITGSDRDEIEPLVTESNINGAGERIATKVWELHRPDVFNKRINEETILKELKEQSEGSDKIFDAAKIAFHEKLDAYRRDEADFNNANLNEVSMMLQNNTSLSVIRRNTAFLNLPGVMGTNFITTWENNLSIKVERERKERERIEKEESDKLVGTLKQKANNDEVVTQNEINELPNIRDRIDVENYIKNIEKEKMATAEKKKKEVTEKLKGIVRMTIFDKPFTELEKMREFIALDEGSQVELLKEKRTELERVEKERKEALKNDENENVRAVYGLVEAGADWNAVSESPKYIAIKDNEKKLTIQNIFKNRKEKEEVDERIKTGEARAVRAEERVGRTEATRIEKEAAEKKKTKALNEIDGAIEGGKTLSQIKELSAYQSLTYTERSEKMDKLETKAKAKEKEAEAELEKESNRKQKELIKEVRDKVKEGLKVVDIKEYDSLESANQMTIDDWVEARGERLDAKAEKERNKAKAGSKEQKTEKEERIEEAVATARAENKSLSQINAILKQEGATAKHSGEILKKIEDEEHTKRERARTEVERAIEKLKDEKQVKQNNLLNKVYEEVSTGKDPKTIIEYDYLKVESKRLLDSLYRTETDYKEAKAEKLLKREIEKNRQIVIALTRADKPYNDTEAFKSLPPDEQEKIDEGVRMKKQILESIKAQALSNIEKNAVNDVAEMIVAGRKIEEIKTTDAWANLPGTAKQSVMECEDRKKEEAIREAEALKEKAEKKTISEKLGILGTDLLENVNYKAANYIKTIKEQINHLRNVKNSQAYIELGKINPERRNDFDDKVIQPRIEELEKKIEDIEKTNTELNQTLQYGKFLANPEDDAHTIPKLNTLFIEGNLSKVQYESAMGMKQKRDPLKDPRLAVANKIINDLYEGKQFSGDVAENNMAYLEIMNILKDVINTTYAEENDDKFDKKLKSFMEIIQKKPESGILNWLSEWGKSMSNLFVYGKFLPSPDKDPVQEKINKLREVWELESPIPKTETQAPKLKYGNKEAEKSPENTWFERARRMPENKNYTDEQLRRAEKKRKNK